MILYVHFLTNTTVKKFKIQNLSTPGFYAGQRIENVQQRKWKKTSGKELQLGSTIQIYRQNVM